MMIMTTTTCSETFVPSYDLVSWDAESFDDEQLLVICEVLYNQPTKEVVVELCQPE